MCLSRSQNRWNLSPKIANLGDGAPIIDEQHSKYVPVRPKTIMSCYLGLFVWRINEYHSVKFLFLSWSQNRWNLSPKIANFGAGAPIINEQHSKYVPVSPKTIIIFG